MNIEDKIYVAGHKGLVGSTIYKKLTELGYKNIITVDEKALDLRRQNEVEDFFISHKPDYVFLAAAKVGGIVANNTFKAEFIYDNLTIALNVINTAYKTGVKKLLNLGSSCIYPKLAPQPLKEEYLLSGYLEETNEPYALAKIAAIKLCTSYNFQYGTDFISVMPTNLYGKNDNFNLQTSHVMPALVRKMILAKAMMNNDFNFIRKDISMIKLGFGLDEKINLNEETSIVKSLEEVGVRKESVTIWGTGKVMREFLHVEDMSEACIFLMKNHGARQIRDFVNLGTGKDISIAGLATLIKNIVEYDGDLIYDHSKPDGTAQKLLDISRISSLGWKAKIELEEGIRKSVNDYYSFN